MNLKLENYLSFSLLGLLTLFLGFMFVYPGTWVFSLPTHLTLHTVLEFFAILISFMIFSVGWATAKNVKSRSILLLSVTSLAVGILDFGHVLSYPGMPHFFGENYPDKAIYFWLTARTIDALALVAVPLITDRERRFNPLRTGYFTSTIALIALVYYVILFRNQMLPRLFIPGVGLTPLKVACEYVIVGFFLLASFLCFQKNRSENILSFRWLAFGAMTMAMSEMFFTFYNSPSDIYNVAGHVYKAVGFGFMYRGVFLECVSKPYQEVRHYARKAKAANETKTQFLANVSHEFRTPLGVIHGFSDLLYSTKSFDEEAKGWIQTIQRNSSQLRHLIDDLLDLTKVETGRLAIQKEKFSLNEVIDDVMGGFSLPAQEKGIELRLQRHPDLPQTIFTDPIRFRQILVNLLSNAIKFTDKGFVELEIRPEPGSSQKGEHLMVSIRDSGMGISFKQASRLFQPFSQGDDSMSRRFGGTGLGLSLSRRLAHILGGDLWLQFSRPGQGSVFSLLLPTWSHQDSQALPQKKEEERHQGEPLKVPQRRENSLHNKRILLVEDAKDNQLLLERYLKMNGAQVTLAANGREGLAATEASNFDVIFMDIQMPEMDGYEATNRLRKQGNQTPIIALTAHALQTEKTRALNSGFDDYIIKPVTQEQLKEAVLKFSPSQAVGSPS